MRTRGAVAAILWLGVGMAAWAQDAAPTLAWLRDHPDVQPKQVALSEETPFTVVLDGKPVGSAAVAAGTEVDLAAVGDKTITLGRAGGQAEVDPAKTDLWDRVGALKARKEKDTAIDPTAALQLPSDSLPADWYAAQIRDKFDPWLAAHPGDSRADFIKARRDALAAEMSRVAAGEARHGDRWLAPEELFEWKGDAAAADLRQRLDEAARRGDAATLSGIVAQVPSQRKAAAYPALVRASLAAINAVLPTLTDERAKGDLEAKRNALAAQDDKLFADLQAAVSKPYLTSSTPEPGWAKYDDGLYHPAPTGGKGYGWYTADHFPELMDYFPDIHTQYEQPTDEEVDRLKIDAAKEKAIRAQKIELEKGMDAAVAAAAKDRDDLAQLRAKLAAEPIDKMEQAVAKLPAAAERFAAGDVDGGKAIVDDAEAAWPGSEAIARWRLDQAAAALRDGKKPVAGALLGGVLDWPRAVRLRAEAGAKPSPAQTLAAAPVSPSAPAAPIPDAPKTDEARHHDASRTAWKQGVEAFTHGQVAEAWKQFVEAREQWPDNPAVNDAMFYAQIAGGIAAVLLLLWLWKGRG